MTAVAAPVGTRAEGVVRTLGLGPLALESGQVLPAASLAYEGTLGGGAARELYLRGERLSVYLHPITADFFLLLALDARSNLGQARLYGRDAARRLEGYL